MRGLRGLLSIMSTERVVIVESADDRGSLQRTAAGHMKERVTVPGSPGDDDDLSDLLAAGTREVHKKSENTRFVKDFLKGRIHMELFKLGTVALYYIYTALEEEIEKNKLHPQVAPLYFPTELHRREALTRDLEFFYGPDWRSQVRCSPATRRYAEHIRRVGREEDPVLLVAHAYTRQMGDLSGGQVLKKVAQRALELPPTGEGLAFYRFDGIHTGVKAFKQLYRSRLNELALDSETKRRVVAEAVRAFRFNIEVFEELDEIGKTFQEDVFKNTGMHDVHGAVSGCPYYRASGGGTACQRGMASLGHPAGQVLFAAWLASLAGLAAWYLM